MKIEAKIRHRRPAPLHHRFTGVTNEEQLVNIQPSLYLDQPRTENEGFPLSIHNTDERSLIAVHSVMRPWTIPNSDVIVELLIGNTVLGIEGTENPVPTSSSRDAMNCNRLMAWAQTVASSDTVIVGVGRLGFSVLRGPVIALRRLAGPGMMLEIGGTATGRDEKPPMIEASTGDAAGGTAIGPPLGTDVAVYTIGSALVGSVTDGTELTRRVGREGIATCRASCWPGAGLAETRRTDISKVRLMWVCIMMVIF